MTATDEALAVAPDRWAATVEDLCGLKGLRVAGRAGSVADGLFLRGWGALSRGAPAELVAMAVTARALVATRLGGIDAELLGMEATVAEETAHAVEQRALVDALGERLPAPALAGLAGALGSPAVALADEPHAPAFAVRLAEQPRAGVTAPGLPRLPLDPAETHAEHCVVVACGGALLALDAGYDPVEPFLCGLAHHLHNAWLPDAGFAGETILGDGTLDAIVGPLRRRALAELEAPLADAVADALRLTTDTLSPLAQAFGTADVLDRVLQLRRYERQATFRLADAVDRYAIVHAGPAQALGLRVLDAAGLR